MIVIRIAMNAIPEKQLELLQTLLAMIEPTAKKTGCLSLGVFCDIEDKNRFSLLGEWKTRDDLDRHMTSLQFSVLLGTKALLCKPLEVQILTVSHSEGMDAVRMVRNNNRSIRSPADRHGSLTK
jgi:quinol monooxygenase YgiN